MKFEKHPTSIEEQVALLEARGMSIGDLDHAKRCLVTIGYYRLSAYWLPFEKPTSNGATRSKLFKADTAFDRVYDLYVFDRRLRVLLMEAIERIEIHVRARWVYHMAHSFGTHAYLEHRLFVGGLKHTEQLHRLARAVSKSDEVFIRHYAGKYTDPYLPPLWAATELMTLGELSKWFQATKENSVKSRIASDLGLPTREVCESVLQTLSYVRNICAHHGRLWNRRLVKRMPKIKRFGRDMVFDEINGSEQSANLIYNALVVVVHLLHRQNTDATFRVRLQELVEEVEPEDRRAMGFPEDWKSRPVWHY